MVAITIRRVNGQVVFDPNPGTAGRGDAAMFTNLDPQAAHWITEQGLARDTLMDAPLVAYVEGQDAASSPTLALPDQSKTADIIKTYVRSLHPGEQCTIKIPKR
jgi:hypothetical protein